MANPAAVFVLIFASALALASMKESPNLRDEGYSGSNKELWKLDQLLRFGKAGMYDRRQTPAAAAGSATEVHIEMYIRSFGSINPMQMDYTVDLYLRQRWVEVRFLNNTLTRPLDVSDPILVKILWKPEVYFPNAKESDFQYVTMPNVMLRIHPDGTILYILRLKLTFSCMMDLSSFPLDHQTCFMQVASFVKTTRELELVWYNNNPIKIYKHLKLPQFEMKAIKPDTCGLSLHIGNYSCLQAVFELRRNVGYHLVQSYLPTSLIVVVSWVSFWLDVDAIPSRVTLGVTTLLTVCSESTSFRDKMPTVSYVKALDIWMGSCTAFVFLALVEFTVVIHLARHHRRFLFWESTYVKQVLYGGIFNTSSAAILKSGGSQQLPACSRKLSVPKSSSPEDLPLQSCSSHCKDIGGGGRRESASKGRLMDSYEETIIENPRVYQALPRQNLEAVPPDTLRQHIVHLKKGRDSSGATVTLTSPPPTEAVTSPFDFEDQEGTGWDCLGGGDCNCHSGHDSDTSLTEPDREELTSLLKRWGENAVMAKKIDKLSRAVFPFMFLLFNVIYWGYYTVWA